MSAIILASASTARRRLLANAGIVFEARVAPIDERAAEAPLLAAGAGLDDVAAILAEVKALSVSESAPDAFVIGADQVLDMAGERFSKPVDMEAARLQLVRLSGRSHALHSAIAVARGAEVLFRHVETAHLTLRKLTPRAIGTYLAGVGEAALSSPGVYQVEGPGIQLIERIEGDFFGIVGLPMLPLLKFLREAGALES